MAEQAPRGTVRHFPIVVEQDEDGAFIVTCPTFKGCHTYGHTIEEALDNIREAIQLCLEDEPDAPLNRFIGVRDLELAVDA